MCGIVGIIGKKNPREYLIKGLDTLEYRGYDSAGIAFLNEKINIIKDVGTISHLNEVVPPSLDSSIAIGHTRWATHGVVNKLNSHPHISYHEEFALVHNGVIENYLLIKEVLVREGYKFKSTTDSEIVVNLIEYYYRKYQNMSTTLEKTLETIRGSFAIALMHVGDEHLYILKNDSPLLIGICEDCRMLASDASAMIDYTDKFIEIGDYEYGIISKENCDIFSIKGQIVLHKPITKKVDDIKHDKCGFPHYMLKEIYEIDNVIAKLIKTYFKGEKFSFPLNVKKLITSSDHIIFIACGTSYHASLIGARYFEKLGIPCSNYIASEWAFSPIIHGKRPLFILLSQSGETGDLIHCSKVINEKEYNSLLLTNTSGSTLERLARYTLNIYAGVEVSVASTKAYVAEVLMLLLIAKSLNNEIHIKKELNEARKTIVSIREQYLEKIKEIADKIRSHHSIFYLGRGYDYCFSLEASLKLKEISYIHSEAIAGGELKHGPIALIDQNVPVIVFVTDPICASMMRGNIEEVKARGADVYVFSTEFLSYPDDAVIINDFPIYLSPIIISTLAFLLAYYVSLYKGLNVDRPRNLAKSVTVE
ncbi:MAG: glutamine--fructose-6-phosphate transaminase (isomerizing) [Bacilli bacterium]|nr:glutamine--fructose-6-phosphate transaminase (isomerizing) [Bacilli bacterium]